MARIPTIESLKENNKIFFSKRSVKFHGDQGYEIVRKDNMFVLKIRTKQELPSGKKTAKNVYYNIDEKNQHLSYRGEF